MPSIAEIIAAKKAKAAVKTQVSNEDRELDEAIDRIDPPKKHKALVLSASTPLPAADVAQTAHYKELRKLSQPRSEPPPSKDAWGAVMGCTEQDLCLMRDPSDPETCWLAVRHQECDHPPILIMRLPWLLWDSPTSDEIPF